MPDANAVNSMFGRISRRYDLANHLLIGGCDFQWRRKLVRAVRDCGARRILDLATGSGDVAFALAEGLPAGTSVVGMDFCEPMLEQAGLKQRAFACRRARIEFQHGDGMALPLPDHTFDAVTISFGLRNMPDRHQCLREMRRVLRPGGCLFVLEFSQPHWWFRPCYYLYLRLLLPHLAAWITGDRGAYEYLGGSIAQFPDRAAMSAEIARAGYSRVRSRPLTFGIVALHEAAA